MSGREGGEEKREKERVSERERGAGKREIEKKR